MNNVRTIVVLFRKRNHITHFYGDLYSEKMIFNFKGFIIYRAEFKEPYKFSFFIITYCKSLKNYKL